jgi:hypothetical protein
MKKNDNHRIDEVEKYYTPIKKVEKIIAILFWLITLISLFLLHPSSIIGNRLFNIIQTSFLTFTLIHFSLSQISRFYLIPKAEKMRRKQLLSDSFGSRLSHERTSLYYNNKYTPSVKRLGANTMENAFFTQEITAEMLITKRWITCIYLIVWVILFTLRHDNLELLTKMTQIIFSGEILASWIKLEVLHFRAEKTYDQLHDHFLHDISDDNPKAIANVLDAFVAYESAKSSAGILLSQKIFCCLNPTLSSKWMQIRSDLNMDFNEKLTEQNME